MFAHRLESENTDSSLWPVHGMAMPHLIGVNMKPSGSFLYVALERRRFARRGLPCFCCSDAFK